MSAGETPAEDAGTAARPPSLSESLAQLHAAGREGLGAGMDSLRALRRLVAADLALARAALARALVWLTMGVAFGASAWMLLMAAGIALLRNFGLSWLASISLLTLLSLLCAGGAGYMALRYFNMSRLDATRRQLTRLGLGDDGEDADEHSPPPASPPPPPPPAGAEA